MPIAVVCRACQKRFNVGDDAGGKRIKCPCGATVPVPVSRSQPAPEEAEEGDDAPSSTAVTWRLLVGGLGAFLLIPGVLLIVKAARIGQRERSVVSAEVDLNAHGYFIRLRGALKAEEVCADPAVSDAVARMNRGYPKSGQEAEWSEEQRKEFDAASNQCRKAIDAWKKQQMKRTDAAGIPGLGLSIAGAVLLAATGVWWLAARQPRPN